MTSPTKKTTGPLSATRRWAFGAAVVLPLLLLGFVPMQRHLAQGQPGGAVGFRTALSTASIENWQIANAMAADHFLVIGLVSLAITLATFLVLRMRGITRGRTWWGVATALLMLQCAALAVSVVLIDGGLRNRVPETAVQVQAPSSFGAEHAMAFAFAVLVPILLMAFYPAMRRAAEDGPNSFFGFRTALAYQSEAHWRVAQLFAGRFYLETGAVFLTLTLIAYAWLLATGDRSTSTWWNLSLAAALAPAVAMIATIPVVHRKVRAEVGE